jgi:NitT/TauT family transport system ATP-binding protein
MLSPSLDSHAAASRGVASAANAPRERAIRVAGLTKEFSTASGDRVLALAGVDLDVRAGEFISVVGPSGCGKSTLLKIVAGLQAPSGGEVEVDGERVRGPRRDIGVVFQAPLLLPWRTVRDNALLPLDLQGRDRRPYEAKVDALLKLVGLHDFANKYPYELSGGMQQRAGITRALVDDPKILLMDEPFGALDAMMREHMNAELQRIWLERRNTVLFITHSIPEAVFLSDRVVAMTARPGRVAEVVPIDLPRPRTLDMMASDAFGRYAARIRAHFNLGTGVDL